MGDIADIEALAASRAAACIATSKKVKEALAEMGIPDERIRVIHNAIEDYWFDEPREEKISEPHLVFLGRLGNDVFTLKLKGLSRLVQFYRSFPEVPKTTICMTTNRKLKDWLRVSFPKHYMFVNLRKDLIPGALAARYGSIMFLPSRYEGFSLSVIEGMSQGLEPISYAVGVAAEVIQNGENGYIVASQEEAVTRAKELLSNPEMRLAMAARAKETAQKFKSVRIADELLALYKDVKQQRRAKQSGKEIPHIELS